MHRAQKNVKSFTRFYCDPFECSICAVLYCLVYILENNLIQIAISKKSLLTF